MAILCSDAGVSCNAHPSQCKAMALAGRAATRPGNMALVCSAPHDAQTVQLAFLGQFSACVDAYTGLEHVCPTPVGALVPVRASVEGKMNDPGIDLRLSPGWAGNRGHRTRVKHAQFGSPQWCGTATLQ